MPTKFGRTHGIGNTDCACRRVKVNPSKAYLDLLEYEMDQLKKHPGVIFERDFNPPWIKRACVNCTLTYLEQQESGIFKCSKCGLIKVPVGVDYKIESKK